ncbi:hypothetical protein BJX63DRAFT_432749 [Aspergillus granulosus]|uniref:Zn(2)-C6 fungal-type domain-containing protein n=1 Tax=Aspergillus granulosus TaxID=176169 RepID=A0ABR4HA07_9EURO
MRLGTKSCAECRRRKVRCIYPAGSEICRQCEAHCTPCQKQGTPRQQGTAGGGESIEVLSNKVQDLERLVALLCGGRVVSPESRGVMDSDEALTLLCPTSARDVRRGVVSGGIDAEKETPVSDGPLWTMMNRALSIESTVQPPASTDPGSRRRSQAVNALRALALSTEDLQLVFEMTEKYWPLWPILPPRFIQVIPSQGGGLDKTTALNFITDSFQSNIPEVMAKGALWLSLCIQQLPSGFDFCPHKLPCHRTVLLEAYMSGAEELLRSPHDAQTTTTVLECLMLQIKLCINMARPRKAWLTVRRAIDFALLQGIQRLRASPVSETLQSIWLEIWAFDRQLSLGLGLPNSVPDSLANRVRLPDGEFSTWIFHLIGGIAGRINDRNLNSASADYALTMSIEHELLGLWDQLPAQWDMPNTEDMSLADVFMKQAGKFFYHLLLKNLHFPFMVQQTSNGDGELYRHSWNTAAQAARQMIDHYHVLRRSGQGALLICDLMDFHVFTAAIVLFIHLISPLALSERDMEQEKQDWAQIQDLIQTFKHLSLAMTCTVAKQAADVLGYLYAAAHGFYYDREPYEVVIPYFGKVRISPPVQRQQQHTSISTSGSVSDELSHVPSPHPFNAIEFHAQTFCPHGPDAMGLGDGELGTMDWTSFSEIEFDWDWSEVFTIPMDG